MTKRVEVPPKGVGYGYVGVWSHGHLGSFMPHYLITTGSDQSLRRFPQANNGGGRDQYLEGTRSFLCRITIEPVLDAAGRPVTKIHGGGDG